MTPAIADASIFREGYAFTNSSRGATKRGWHSTCRECKTARRPSRLGGRVVIECSLSQPITRAYLHTRGRWSNEHQSISKLDSTPATLLHRACCLFGPSAPSTPPACVDLLHLAVVLSEPRTSSLSITSPLPFFTLDTTVYEAVCTVLPPAPALIFKSA